jgi:hypothetical protein
MATKMGSQQSHVVKTKLHLYHVLVAFATTRIENLQFVNKLGFEL